MPRSVLGMVLGVSLGLWAGQPIPSSQEPPASEGQPTRQYFSGEVSEATSEKVTVIRTLIGKQPVARTFLLTAATRIEGRVRPKARVTVRYVTRDEGDEAVYILVRPAPKKP